MVFRSSDLIAICAIMILFAVPAMGISVNCATNEASSSASYDLDASTLLSNKDIFVDGKHSHTSLVSGSGDNEYSYQESAGQSTAESSIDSSGQLVSTTSALASDDGIIQNQNVEGSGNATASLQGQSDTTTTEQGSTVSNGDLSTSTSLTTGKGYSISTQSTHVEGDSGAIISGSVSPENAMGVTGSYDKKNSLDANLIAAAAESAGVYGTTQASDGQGIGSSALQDIASNDGTGLEVNGCYMTSSQDIGEYTIKAANARIHGRRAPWIEPPYKTFAKLDDNAQVHLLLYDSDIPSYLDAETIATAISNGANEWDINTNQNLFMGDDNANAQGSSNAVELVSGSTSSTPDKDNLWTEAWTSLSSGTIGVTYIWTSGISMGYDGRYHSTITETDCRYNSDLTWSTAATSESSSSNTIYDVRTIATHELGHTVGLDDLYGYYNKDKIMYGYNDGSVKWYLRNGDKDGLTSLYGP